jgi:hypothetical protein
MRTPERSGGGRSSAAFMSPREAPRESLIDNSRVISASPSTRPSASKLELTLSGVTTCEELARVLESRRGSSTLSDAVKAIDVIEHVLKRNRENLREFFSTCFQPILWQIFSFDGSTSSGWMNGAFNGSERDTRALLEFLSPDGAFMRAMLAADSDKLVQFAFPLERLPERTQRMLQTESGAMSLNRSPPYTGCVKRDSTGRYQVHLGLYNYFMFWTAYFAMRPGSRRASSTSSSYSTRSSSYKGMSSFGGAGGSSAFLGAQWTGSPLSRPAPAKVHPYRELLLSHLRYFLPRSPTQGRDWSKSDNGNVAQGELFVSILAEFWMPVEDTRAHPSDASRSGSPFRRTPAMGRVVDAAMRQAGMSPPRSIESRQETRRYAYNPPVVDHVNAVTLLTTYLFADLPDKQTENAESMKIIERARDSVQKPLYCFLRDAFTQWPTESSSNLEPIVTLWVAYFAPWCAKYPESQIKSSSSKRSSSPARMLTSQLTSPLKSPLGSSSSSSSIVQYDKPLLPAGKELKFDDKVVDTPGRFSHVRHVLKSVPFYHELMKHFLELCCKRVPLDAEGTAAALLIALKPLAAAPALLKLLHSVEEGYADFVLDPFKGTLKTMQAREETTANAESYYPLIRSQLQEWEPEVDPVVLGADSLPGTPGSLHTPLSKWHGAAARLAANRVSELDKAKAVSKHLRMFTSETDGLAQVAIALIHRLERDATQVPNSHPLRKSVPSFREASFIVFRLERFRDTPYLKSPIASKFVDANAGESRPGWASVRKSAKEMYKGDWMHRPIGANEISILVRLLVPLSVFLNGKLGLDGVATDASRKITLSDVRSVVEQSWASARGIERKNAVMEYLIPVIAVMEGMTIGICRRKGLTVNLRPLAEYQMLAMLFAVYMVLGFFRAILSLE